MEVITIILLKATLVYFVHAAETEEDNTDPHSLECNKTYTVSLKNNYLFNLNQDRCWYKFNGSKRKKCTAELVCNRMNFNPGDCKTKYFKLSDKNGGEMKTCNRNTFLTPYRASKNDTDLKVNYAGQIKDTMCTVSCAEQTQHKKPFKILLKVPKRKIDDSCVCGVSNNQQGRIIGGADSQPFEYPWLSALVFIDTREVFCGASLINSEYLLSAAHCFYPDMTPDLFDIVLHSHVMDLSLNEYANVTAKPGEKGSIVDVKGLDLKDYTDEDESSIRLKPKDVFLHPFYDDDTVDYDVALIKLTKKVDLTDSRLGSICLPKQTEAIEYSQKNATVAGWGRPLAKSGAGNRILQKLDIPLFYNRKCKRLMNDLTSRMICGGYLEGGKDACVGDSGGPLIFRFNEHQHRQIGVVSFGIGCALPDLPGISTKSTECKTIKP